MYLADFASSYISKRHDLPVEADEIKSYTAPVSNIDDVELKGNPNYQGIVS